MQSVNVEGGRIKFENYSKQLPVPFKIYADFECNLRDNEVYEGWYTKKYDDHIPCCYAYKIVCINENVIMYEEKEYLFVQTNSCWICGKLIDNDDENE